MFMRGRGPNGEVARLLIRQICHLSLIVKLYLGDEGRTFSSLEQMASFLLVQDGLEAQEDILIKICAP